MKRKRLLLGLVVVFAAAALGVLLEPTHVVRGYLRGEAFFDGRPVSYWRSSLTSQDPQVQARTRQRLQGGGPAAVPVLVALLGDRAEVRWKAAHLLGRLGADAAGAAGALVEALGDPDLHVRTVAAASLGALTPPPEEAIKPLADLLARADRSSAAAARSLSRFGPGARPAIPALLAALQAKDAEVRWNAARTLGKVGPAAKGAVGALVAATRDDDAKVREHAAEALGDIGPEARGGVPALIAVLKDPAPRVRRDAARSLGQIGLAARPAVPALKGLLEDRDPQVRQAAARALRVLTPSR